MLRNRTFKANPEEREAVLQLLDQHGDGVGAVTRELPEEQGPLLVDVAGHLFRVHQDGQVDQLEAPQ